jgi:uncharacterized protein (DUF488 family)
MKRPCIFTVGHSTGSIDEFLELLQAHGIKGIVDIRSIPRSRHNPQFNTDDLKQSPEREHMSYKHIKVATSFVFQILPRMRSDGEENGEGIYKHKKQSRQAAAETRRKANSPAIRG